MTIANNFQLEAQFKKPQQAAVLNELTNNTVFFGGSNITYRYFLILITDPLSVVVCVRLFA